MENNKENNHAMNKLLSVRMNEADYKQLEETAKKNYLTVSSYIRQLISKVLYENGGKTE